MLFSRLRNAILSHLVITFSDSYLCFILHPFHLGRANTVKSIQCAPLCYGRLLIYLVSPSNLAKWVLVTFQLRPRKRSFQKDLHVCL